MVEIFVAMAILAIGLLGLLGMTQMVVKGNDSANQMNEASNACQIKLEELKVEEYEVLGTMTPGDPDDIVFGLIEGGMVQELQLNGQGLTDCDYLFQQSQTATSACEPLADADIDSICPAARTALLLEDEVVTISSEDCWNEIEQAGPYMYTRTFAVCRGDEYAGGVHPATPTVNVTDLNGGAYSGEVNCMASPGDADADPVVADARPPNLACNEGDIVSPGPASQEKLIKVLCTWRKRDGRCGFVNYSALRTDLGN